MVFVFLQLSALFAYDIAHVVSNNSIQDYDMVALSPKNVTHKALGASRGIWAASGSPPGVPTVRPSRRGQWSV